MKALLITLFSLVLLNFFGLVQYTYIIYAINAYFIANFIYSVWIRRKVKTPFDFALSVVLVGLILSGISSSYYENSNPLYVYFAYQFILALYFYIILVNKDTQVKHVEKALTYLSLALCVFYIVQYIAFQRGIVLTDMFADGYDAEAGDLVRFRAVGSALAAWAYFYGLNGVLVSQKKSFLKVLLLVLGLAVILLMSFRTMVAGLMLCTLVMVIKVNGLKSGLFKYLFLLFVAIVVAYNVPTVQKKIDYMIEKQQGDQTLANDEYIRWINFYYHLDENTKDDVEYYLGVGLNADKNSSLCIKEDNLMEQHLSWVDWGLIGLSWQVGLLTVLGMLLYSFKVIKFRFEPEQVCISVFFLYLVLISITTLEFARTGNFVVQALVLYLATYYIKKQK